MSAQATLDFDRPDCLPTPPFQRHSRTSRAAAERMRAKAPSKEEQVWQWLWECGPATDNEIIDHFHGVLKWSANTPRARRRGLELKGRVAKTGEERNGCAVWRAVGP